MGVASRGSSLPKAEKDAAKMGANEREGVRGGRGRPSGGRSRDMVVKRKAEGESCRLWNRGDEHSVQDEGALKLVSDGLARPGGATTLCPGRCFSAADAPAYRRP